MGNAFKLSDEIVKQVEELTALGVPIEVMAPALGVSYGSLYGWKRKGEKFFEGNKKPKTEIDALCLQLFKARKKGLNRFVAANLQHIVRAAPKNWQAAAWLLERRFPEYFAKQEPKEKDDKNKQPELTSAGKLSDEVLIRQYESYKLTNYN